MRGLIVSGLALVGFACGVAQAQEYPRAPKVHGGAVRVACQADLDKFCPPGQGPGMFKCLREHQSQVSDACKAAMANVQERHRLEQQGAGGPQGYPSAGR